MSLPLESKEQNALRRSDVEKFAIGIEIARNPKY
jgi:hypothetical protein